MRRTIAVVIAIVLGSLAGVMALAAAANLRGPVTFDMTAGLPRSVAAGFYPPERVGDLTFSWTSGRADLTLAGLARDRVWSCAARLRAARGTPPVPHLDILVDGVVLVSREVPNDFEDVRFDFAARSSRSDTRISFVVTPTMVPGPQDRRQLGVQVDRISCAPSVGTVPSPRAATIAAVVVPAAFAGSAVLGGATAAGAIVVALAVAAAQTIPLDTGAAAFTPFTRTMLLLGLWIPALALISVRAAGALRRAPLSRFTASFASAAAAAVYLQLLGLLHPAKPPIDVIFQTHRLDAVLAGNYFFTQLMPGGVRFPYAIGLYLFAAPWARLASDHAALLRIVVCASDAVSYLFLFWLVIRVWGDRVAAGVTLMLAFTLPIAFEVIGNANLTNEFGHAASTAALALAAATAGSRRGLLTTLLLTVVCTLAFLSHVSTFALLFATLVAFVVLEWWAGDPELRRGARTLLVVTVAAAALAFVGYYGHFMDVYKDALRVRTGGVAASASPPPAPSEPVRGQTAASLPMRVVDSVRLSGSWTGWPLLLLGAAGAWRIVRERRRDPAALAIGACAVAYVVFVGVAVVRVQPAYQRYTVEFVSRVVLATSPGVLLLAGAGASWGLRGGLVAKMVIALLIGAAFFLAGQQWIMWFA